MSNRDKVKQSDGSVKKVYVPRDERRRRRNERRIKLGAPPEIPVSRKRKDAQGASEKAQPKSYNGVVQLVSPTTGRPITEPIPAKAGDTAFLIDGVRYVWDGLGGAEGFLRWARTHETKFRELALKLLPSQVAIQQEGLGQTIFIKHALPPPNYQPAPHVHAGEAPEQPQGRVIEVVQTVDVEALRQALLSLSPAERRQILADADSEDAERSEE